MLGELAPPLQGGSLGDMEYLMEAAGVRAEHRGTAEAVTQVLSESVSRVLLVSFSRMYSALRLVGSCWVRFVESFRLNMARQACGRAPRHRRGRNARPAEYSADRGAGRVVRVLAQEPGAHLS